MKSANEAERTAPGERPEKRKGEDFEEDPGGPGAPDNRSAGNSKPGKTETGETEAGAKDEGGKMR